MNSFDEEKARFFCGDWADFSSLLQRKSQTSQQYAKQEENEHEKYDLIFGCETLYNSKNHHKFYKVIQQFLKRNGLCFLAQKMYYFGVGGGVADFKALVESKNEMDILLLKKVEKKNQNLREIVCLKFK